MENIRREKLKIMQIAPHYLPITEDLRYGGIERRTLNLDKAFSEQGHESLIVATGDSKIRGKLCPTLFQGVLTLKKNKDKGWRYNLKDSSDKLYQDHCKKTLDFIETFNPDIIHDQGGGFIQSEVFKNAEELPPILCTLCGPLNPDNYDKFVELNEKIKGKGVWFSAQSKSHQRDFEQILNVNYFVYNGVNINEWPFQEKGQGFLFSLGLISQYKGQHIALNVANRLKEKIILAGPIHDCVDSMKNYWEKMIEPRIDRFEKNIFPNQVEGFISEFMESKDRTAYVGELDDAQKKEFYQRAKAFVHPGTAKESFCNTLIESMVCGTPVVAFNIGSIPELVKNGGTGYVIDTDFYDIENSSNYLVEVVEEGINDFAEAITQISNISRKDCREHVSNNLNLNLQAEKYLRIY